jgi:hypothetical protein
VVLLLGAFKVVVLLHGVVTVTMMFEYYFITAAHTN